jgi:hypothetical protein
MYKVRLKAHHVFLGFLKAVLRVTSKSFAISSIAMPSIFLIIGLIVGL